MNEQNLLRIDRPLTMEEILTYYYNMFSDKLIANVVDVQHYEFIKSINPKYKTVNSQGMPVTVDMLIENNRNGAVYARENVARIKALMESEKAGTLAEAWSDKMLGREKIENFIKGPASEDNQG